METQEQERNNNNNKQRRVIIATYRVQTPRRRSWNRKMERKNSSPIGPVYYLSMSDANQVESSPLPECVNCTDQLLPAGRNNMCAENQVC